ncbi:YqjF family protein [Planococcus sp. YIM B11945]|uniref:YqjF family protein n=1 Tax=Planococcus sp. YIM B11945 TaxID=3435410 RepID=UPI003D7DEA6C
MEKPWIMFQQWEDVLFLHWPVPQKLLVPHIPAELELDAYDGCAWISLVLFKAKNTRPRFMPPVPGVRTYLELNVRTYVKCKGKAGVFFFSLDADSLLAVKAATTGDFLPYRYARMCLAKKEETWKFSSQVIHPGTVPESLRLSFQIASPPIEKNRLDRWLVERYCLWTKPKNQVFRVDIAHEPWTLQYVKGSIHHNSMASFILVKLPQEQAIVHYSKSQKVRFYPPVIEK